MGHCSASYAPDVSEGAAYFYRIEQPERATLMLRRTTRGWRLGELRGRRNGRVSKVVRVAVRRWLQGDDRQAELPLGQGR